MNKPVLMKRLRMAIFVTKVPTSSDHCNTPAFRNNIIKNNVESSNTSNHDKGAVDEREAASHDVSALLLSTRVHTIRNNVYS